jgi:hypothetical protein
LTAESCMQRPHGKWPLSTNQYQANASWTEQGNSSPATARDPKLGQQGKWGGIGLWVGYLVNNSSQNPQLSEGRGNRPLLTPRRHTSLWLKHHHYCRGSAERYSRSTVSFFYPDRTIYFIFLAKYNIL